MSLRVAYVITDSGIGGTEKALLTLLKKVDRAQISPAGVIVTKGRREMAGRWEATGTPVEFLNMGRWPTPRGLMALQKKLDELRPDVVHAFLYHAIQLSRLASRGRSWRLITSPRVNYKFASAPAMWIDRRLRGRDDLSVAESEAGQASLIGLGYPPERVGVAPNGVDADFFQRDEAARRRLRSEWKVGDSELVVGAVGRLHRQKGFDVLIDAASRLSNSPAKFRLIIAGAGPEEPALRALALRMAVNVGFIGERPDMPAVFSAFDIFVQSSRYEGLSNALLEAMAAGLPIAATGVDGTLDFARDGENMLLVRPEDPVGLAVAVGFLLEKGDQRRRLAENAIITARKQSVERMVAAFEQAYRVVTSQST